MPERARGVSEGPGKTRETGLPSDILKDGSVRLGVVVVRSVT